MLRSIPPDPLMRTIHAGGRFLAQTGVEQYRNIVVRSVRLPARKLDCLFLVAVSIRLMAAPAMGSPEPRGTDGQQPMSTADENTESDQIKPRLVKPPIEPHSRGSELYFLVGLSGMLASYAYDTRLSLSGGEELRYSGTRRAPGLALFVSSAFTLPGRLRRMTVAATISAGQLDSANRPVIPSDASPPFAKQSLYSAISDRYSGRLAWGAAFSPFVEHDIGFFHENRVRAGYQYWEQSGSYKGSFAASGNGYHGDYSVRLNLRSHFFRISVNDYGDLSDDPEPAQRATRRFGLVQQWGFMLGSHRTVMLFVAMGPFWQIAPQSVRFR
jgi:hypothetical protein